VRGERRTSFRPSSSSPSVLSQSHCLQGKASRLGLVIRATATGAFSCVTDEIVVLYLWKLLVQRTNAYPHPSSRHSSRLSTDTMAVPGRALQAVRVSSSVSGGHRAGLYFHQDNRTASGLMCWAGCRSMHRVGNYCSVAPMALCPQARVSAAEATRATRSPVRSIATENACASRTAQPKASLLKKA